MHLRRPPVVVEARDLDPRVGQRRADQRADIFVQHAHVELEVVADQRPRSDEFEHPPDGLVDRDALSEIDGADVMDQDRPLGDRLRRADQEVETLAGEDRVALELDRADGEDLVTPSHRGRWSRSRC